MPLPIAEEKIEPWFRNGLKFKCTGCGKCCTGAPGYVWVTEEEIETIAKFLNLSLIDFAEKYLIEVDNRYSLNEDPKNFDCPFLKEKACTIYSARPKQCRTYPWWEQNLSSKEAWEFAKLECEGITEEAPLVPFEEIEKNLLD